MTNGTSADTREYERMLSGELYIADDPYLKEHSLKRRRLVQEINRSDYDEFDKREALFRELFGSFGEGSYIEPPFRADYGCNTYIGRNFYANTDCIFLDVARIDIGDNVFCGPRVSLLTPYHPIDAQVRNEQLEGGKPNLHRQRRMVRWQRHRVPGRHDRRRRGDRRRSVVVKDIPSHCIAVGNPCRPIRAITDADHEQWQRKAREYRAWKEGI